MWKTSRNNQTCCGPAGIPAHMLGQMITRKSNADEHPNGRCAAAAAAVPSLVRENMTQRIQKGGLQIAAVLHDLVANEIIPGTGLSSDQFWASFEKLVTELGPRNKALLAKRDDLQAKIDEWHLSRQDQARDPVAYKEFLTEIGYLLPEGDDFYIGTTNVDPEVDRVAGPQLVVPVMNARYALNAANARWGRLYDALYGTEDFNDPDGKANNNGSHPKICDCAEVYHVDFLGW